MKDEKKEENVIDVEVEQADEAKETSDTSTEVSFKMTEVNDEAVYDEKDGSFKKKKLTKKEKKEAKNAKKKRKKELRKLLWKNKTVLEKFYKVLFVIAVISTVFTLVLDLCIPLTFLLVMVLFLIFMIIVVFTTIFTLGFMWMSNPFKNFIDNYWAFIQKIGSSTDTVEKTVRTIIPYPAFISIVTVTTVLIMAIIMLAKNYDDTEKMLVESNTITEEELQLVHKMKKSNRNINKVRLVVTSILMFVCLVSFIVSIYIMMGVLVKQ